MLIDKEKIFSIIEEKKPRSVAISGPEGIWSELLKLAEEIENKYEIETFVLAEPNYGICDIERYDLEKLDADILFNIGHMNLAGRSGEKIYFVDAFYEIDFSKVLSLAISVLRAKNLSRISVFTINNHFNVLDSVINRLKEEGFDVVMPKEDSMVKSGQVFGCYYVGPISIREHVDACLFLGQSMFHAIGIYLTARKPTFMLDPFFNKVVDVSSEAKNIERRAILSVLKSKESTRFGIVLGLRGTQFQKHRAIQLKEELEALGKDVRLIAMREIVPERLNGMPDIDSFIILACPRIALDMTGFKKPVLSYLQARALVKLLKGQETVEIFEEGVWI